VPLVPAPRTGDGDATTGRPPASPSAGSAKDATAAATGGTAEDTGDAGQRTLDQAVFDDLMSLGPELVASLVATYLETAPERLEALRKAVRVSDLETVAKLAHALKGSSAAMAAQHLAALCADIERAAKYGAGTVPNLVAEADLEYARVVDALQAVVPDVPSRSLLPPASSAWDSWED